MTNIAIREVMKKNGIKFWQIAEQMGMGEASMTRWFRHELEGDRLEKVRKAIDEIVNTREQERS